MISCVWVTSSFVGFHRWPKAPREVVFLRSLHRHKFNAKVRVRVGHDDRQVEFFILKQALELCLQLVMKKLSLDRAMSCEMMARIVLEELGKKYDVIYVSIDEDGENGAELFAEGLISPANAERIKVVSGSNAAPASSVVIE